MKQIVLGISLFFSTLHCSAQSAIWTSPISVAGSVYGNAYPRLALTNGARPQVVWQNGVTDKVYTSRWEANGFGTPITLNPAGTFPYIASWTGAEIAAVQDTVFVVFSTDPDANGARVYTVRSLDAGITFGDTVRVDQIGNDIPRFPSVAVGTGGNPVVNFMHFNAAMEDPEYSIARSLNGGTVYQPAITPTSAVSGWVCDCCPATVVTSGDKHVLLFRNDISNVREIWGCYSTDGSNTYTASGEIDETNWVVNSCPSSGPSGVIAGDSVFSTWMSNGKVYISSASLTTHQIGAHRQLFPLGSGMQNYPVMAGKGDTLAVVWQGSTGGPVDVFFTYSVTGMSGLGVTVDTLTWGTGGTQSRPDIEFSNGEFHIIYSDNLGSDVKYLRGTIDPASLTTTNLSGASSLVIFTAQTDGKTTLHVKSPIQTVASVQLINAAGQQVSLGKYPISSGVSTIAVPESIRKGVYYVIVETEGGSVYKQKVILI